MERPPTRERVLVEELICTGAGGHLTGHGRGGRGEKEQIDRQGKAPRHKQGSDEDRDSNDALASLSIDLVRKDGPVESYPPSEGRSE